MGYRAGMDVSEERKISCPYWNLSRFQWPRGLRRKSAAPRLLELRVRIPSGTRGSVFFERLHVCRVEADHLSRGVLQGMVCLSVISKLQERGNLGSLVAVEPWIKDWDFNSGPYLLY